MKGIVTRNERLNEKYCLMEIRSAEFVKQAKVGQFFMIRPQLFDYINDPLLRRPFAVCDITGEDTFTLVYLLVGKGTALLSEIAAGSSVSLSAPLGKGFTPVSGKRVALAAGGIGIAPMVWLARVLVAAGNHVTLFYGGRSTSDIVITDILRDAASELVITTDDGSVGEKGIVTLPIEKRVGEFDIAYACGPRKMLNAVSDIFVKANLPVEVSLDERMACGIGACLGCIIETEDNGNRRRVRCCVEGPVFDGRKVAWDSVCKH